MFCGKCGAKNTDNAEFCANCGAKLNKSTSTRTAAVSLVTQNDKNRKVGMIAVVVVVVLVIILGVVLFGGRSYKATVKNFVDATFDADAKAIVDLMPEEVITYALEQEGYESGELNDFIDEGDEALQEQLDSLDGYLGEGWKISYNITDDGDIKGDDLDDVKDAYEDVDVKVSAAKNVEVEITVKGNETESSNTLDISLVKIGRSWYLDMMSMGNFF